MGPRLDAIGITTADMASSCRFYVAIVAAGSSSKTEPSDAFWGQRHAYVVDLDGNEVSLFAPLDG